MRFAKRILVKVPYRDETEAFIMNAKFAIETGDSGLN